MNILITGGAGFIGSHLADQLIQEGHYVRALDSIESQVHADYPDYLHPDLDVQLGDIRNPQHVKEALQEIDTVYHFAAKVGVGQSMDLKREYVDINTMGTINLLEQLKQSQVQRLIVASSMSIYGHSDIPTPESSAPHPASVYALTKYDQERLCLMSGLPTIALRFFNVYGPRQSLTNPYTGVVAIFTAAIQEGRQPTVYEDGNQLRDFVHVEDIVQACHLCLTTPFTDHVFNVGSGKRISIKDVARKVAESLGSTIKPNITNVKRVGDVRHCYADISKAQQLLGYRPKHTELTIVPRPAQHD